MNNLELYSKMFLIRCCEKLIIEDYFNDGMKTPMHMSMGSEAVVVGICSMLKNHDQVLGTYRSHALYLAKTGDVNGFFAEMYGKLHGCVQGKGGSMHLCNPEFGHFGSSAIVASPIPVAVGLAFANKMKKNDRLVAVFFGDGATDEGGFWESVNFACLHELPILFVCEDNELAVHTKKPQRRGYSLKDAMSGFRLEFFQSESPDVDDIKSITEQAIENIRTNNKPSIIECHYHRFLEHVGVSQDYKAGYRDCPPSLDAVDPVSVYRKKILSSGVDLSIIQEIETDIEAKARSGVDFAKADEFADVKIIYEDVYA